MKANQFLRNDDAVSPVIAVILMVAITVVLAATVYVWVSGFGSGTVASPAHTMSMTSAGPIVQATNVYSKTYTVSSADPTLTYGDIKVTLAGVQGARDDTGCSLQTPDTTTTFTWGACAGTTERGATSSVAAGDSFKIACYSTAGNCLADKDLLVLDVEANSVMITLKVR